MSIEDKVFTLEVSNNQEVWDILNKTEISHIVDLENNDSVTLEFSTAGEHDDMIDELREALGSRAFPDGKWPNYAGRE